jgi:S1-C subfamily serine protease
MQSKQPMPSAEYLSPEELATVRVFQENTPAVVNISNIIAARTRYSMDVLKIPQGQGSGFIWDTNGHIITNYHVIRGAAEVQVTLIDQTVWKAKIIGGDPSKDVAVLQIQAPADVLKNLKPVAVGESSGLFVGQRVLAIGNPFALDHSLSAGIVSGLNRELATNVGPGLRGVIQTDAAINPGNSGGPLLDSRGRLIGINTAIADPSGKGSSSGVGFAVPIDTVKGLVEQILTYGRVVRPVLGVTIAPPQALRQLGLEGVLILDAPRGSPAAKAGLQGISKDNFGRVVIGDVIVGFNGKPVKSEGDLFDQLDTCKVGDKVQVDVLRQGEKKVSVSVLLGERAPEVTD